MIDLLSQILIYLLAAVVAVPVARRLGLGSVLGYLLAGITIGPALGLVGSETAEVQHFAELGIALMLFLVGLELEPRLLWRLRTQLLGLGALQVFLTAAAIAVAAWLFGLEWRLALAVGLVLSLSSTAIVLQTLSEKGLSGSAGGRASFSVLLFQDVAVIPMLALIPLLALPPGPPATEAGPAATPTAAAEGGGAAGEAEFLVAVSASAAPGAEPGAASAPAAGAGLGGAAADPPGTHAPGHGGGADWVEDLGGPAHALVVLGAVGVIVLGGHFLTRPLFRFIAASRLREIFTASALLLVVAIVLLMLLVDLSPALGTFLAGVVLADSEFRHELKSDIEPFKGLLLGLFFITVGADMDFAVLLAELWLVLALTGAVMALKGGLLYVLGRLFGLPGGERWLFTLSLAQAGEFGFLLLSFSVQNGLIDRGLSSLLALVVALSMLMTPLLFIVHERLVRPRQNARPESPADAIDERGSVVIAGLGRFGQVLNRLLIAAGVRTVVLDHDAAVVERMRRIGIRSWYGDASRPDLLASAGIDEASVFVVAIDDRDRAVAVTEYVRREYPQITIVCRAQDVNHLYLLRNAGADVALREVFETSLKSGGEVLRALGVHPYKAERMIRAFRRHDEQVLEQLYEVWDEDLEMSKNRALLERVRARTEAEQALLASDRSDLHDRSERGWTPPPRHYTDELED